MTEQHRYPVPAADTPGLADPPGTAKVEATEVRSTSSIQARGSA